MKRLHKIFCCSQVLALEPILPKNFLQLLNFLFWYQVDFVCIKRCHKTFLSSQLLGINQIHLIDFFRAFLANRFAILVLFDLGGMKRCHKTFHCSQVLALKPILQKDSLQLLILLFWYLVDFVGIKRCHKTFLSSQLLGINQIQLIDFFRAFFS